MENELEWTDEPWLGMETRAAVRGAQGFVGDDVAPHTEPYHIRLTAPTLEQAEVLQEFGLMLAGVLRDGGRKRAAGTKPSWKVDKSHMPAIYSHLSKYWHGEQVDAESGQHPFVHLACRALMIAWQETHPEEGR